MPGEIRIEDENISQILLFSFYSSVEQNCSDIYR